MDIVLTITGVCAGGNHVFVEVTKGAKTRTFSLNKSDLIGAQDDDFIVDTQEKALCKELRKFAARQGITTFAQLKTACTNLSISI